jgi:hypothetical protein
MDYGAWKELTDEEVAWIAINITQSVAEAILRSTECGDQYGGFDTVLEAVTVALKEHESRKLLSKKGR